MALSEAAVSGLFAREASNLQRFLARKFGADDVQDIVQDAYVRMLTASAVDGPSLKNPKAFLFTVASNIAIDAMRRRQRERRAINCMPGPRAIHTGEEIDVICPNRMPEGRADDWMRINRVIDSLRPLPAKCRAAFLMHKFLDASYAEVAAELGVTVSMVEKYLSQALRHVRESANDPAGPEG